MLCVSHRGNLNGPNHKEENQPKYIFEALNQGFDVEIDVWVVDNKFWLGHDQPQYEVDKTFLLNRKFWHHAKNMEALFSLTELGKKAINCFYHNTDDCVLTSRGYVWTYPRNLPLSSKSIAVMPERVPDWDLSKAYGICTDYPIAFKNNINFKL